MRTDNGATKDARQDAAAPSARSKWAQMKADAAARRDDLQARVDRRADQIDANLAAENADWAEDDAAAAIDARAYADELANATGS